MFEKAQLRGLPTYEVAEAGSLDLDATLIDPNVAMEAIYVVADEFSLDVESLNVEDLRAAYEASKKGGSFSPLELVEPYLNAEAQDKFFTRFIESDHPQIVYDDTLPFLHYADLHDYPLHALTYGVSKPWQEKKIARSKLPFASTVIDHQDKGGEIESWRVGDTYDFVALQHGRPMAIVKAHAISEVDDKRKGYEKRNKRYPRFFMQRAGYEKSANNYLLLQTDPDSGTDLIHGVNELTIVEGHLLKGPRELCDIDVQRARSRMKKPFTQYKPLNSIAA